jgi:hypothetical protein
MRSAVPPFRSARPGGHCRGPRARDRHGPNWTIWTVGILCGLGLANLSEAITVPLPAASVFASVLLAGATALGRILQFRRRVLVWEEPTRPLQR